jgi:hypothetical protein
MSLMSSLQLSDVVKQKRKMSSEGEQDKEEQQEAGEAEEVHESLD